MNFLIYVCKPILSLHQIISKNELKKVILRFLLVHLEVLWVFLHV